MHLALPCREHACLKTAARLGCLLLCLLAACSRASAPASLVSSVPATLPPTWTVTPTAPASTPLQAATAMAASPVPTATVLSPDFWEKLPVIPGQVSQRVREIYQNAWPWAITRTSFRASGTAPAPPRPSWWALMEITTGGVPRAPAGGRLFPGFLWTPQPGCQGRLEQRRAADHALDRQAVPER